MKAPGQKGRAPRSNRSCRRRGRVGRLLGTADHRQPLTGSVALARLAPPPGRAATAALFEYDVHQPPVEFLAAESLDGRRRCLIVCHFDVAKPLGPAATVGPYLDGLYGPELGELSLQVGFSGFMCQVSYV